jgi:hypothetical protein
MRIPEKFLRTRIACNRISEFALLLMEKMVVSAELIRLTALNPLHETQDDPFTGAVRFLN